MDQDEILIELVESLKAQNKDLKKQLDERPEPWLGLSNMWSSFWTTVGGMWKDFWTSSTEMWCVMWQNDSAIFGLVVISIFSIVISGVVSYKMFSPIQPEEPISKLINEYSLEADTYHSCYYVIQERTNGDTDRITLCIKDREEAAQTLKEIQIKHCETNENQTSSN